LVIFDYTIDKAICQFPEVIFLYKKFRSLKFGAVQNAFRQNAFLQAALRGFYFCTLFRERKQGSEKIFPEPNI